MSDTGIFSAGLDATPANFEALTPLSFVERTASTYPEYLAVVYNGVRRNWAETYSRMKKLGSGLAARGIGKDDTVSIIAANISRNV